METKVFEVRDRATFIPVMAIKLNPHNEAERYLLARSGYGRTPHDQNKYVLLSQLDGGNGKITCDSYDWGTERTMGVAHRHIIENFDKLVPGEVIDVEFVLGETTVSKISEQDD